MTSSLNTIRTLKVESNILLVRSTQQRKWYLGEALTAQTCLAKKYSQILSKTHRKTLVQESFLGCRPATLFKKILMSKRFPVNGRKHL